MVEEYFKENKLSKSISILRERRKKIDYEKGNYRFRNFYSIS